MNSKTETTYLDIIERKNPACECDIGNNKPGVKKMYLQNACMDKNGILHELMHALGFRHEHIRYDRDKYCHYHLFTHSGKIHQQF